MMDVKYHSARSQVKSWIRTRYKKEEIESMLAEAMNCVAMEEVPVRMDLPYLHSEFVCEWEFAEFATWRGVLGLGGEKWKSP